MGPRFDLRVGGYIANYSAQRKQKIAIFEVDGSIFEHAQAKSTQMRQCYSPFLGDASGGWTQSVLAAAYLFAIPFEEDE